MLRRVTITFDSNPRDYGKNMAKAMEALENSKKDDMIDAEHLSLFGQHSTLEELIMENANISKKRILRGKKLLNLYT